MFLLNINMLHVRQDRPKVLIIIKLLRKSRGTLFDQGKIVIRPRTAFKPRARREQPSLRSNETTSHHNRTIVQSLPSAKLVHLPKKKGKKSTKKTAAKNLGLHRRTVDAFLLSPTQRRRRRGFEHRLSLTSVTGCRSDALHRSPTRLARAYASPCSVSRGATPSPGRRPPDDMPTAVSSLKGSRPDDLIRDVCRDLILTDEQLRLVMEKLTHELERGLSKETHNEAIVRCYTTYVQDLPTGIEKGNFLALDLGGTNFRVLLITLNGQSFDMKSKIYAIPQSLMLGTGKQLFDHIAQCLALFIKDLKLENEVLPLGFTFSFPLLQQGLTKGLLVRWTKGFNCSGVVNEDVVALLEEAIARRNDVKIDVCAILNDTTGTLMSCAWKNKNCRIGLIVGTGSNACYVEKTDNVECAIPGQYEVHKPCMLINTEWGAFGELGTLDFVLTEFDRDIDDNSINPKKQIFEKMISGMYMGELTRLVLQKLTNAGLLFNGKCSCDLKKRGKFFTKYVSEIESDPKGKYSNCREILAELGIRNVTDQDCENVRYICSVVSRRAAHLASAGIATLLIKMGENNVTVGVDGSVYRFHPHFHDLMVEKISSLQQYKFDLMLSEDGSGRGAALVAAVASQKK